MQFLTLLIILSVTLGTYLTDIHAAPSGLKFLPELLSLVVAAYVFLTGPRQRFRLIPARYWLAFGGAGLVILCGAMINTPPPGSLIGGMRFYLRAIPMFFLPAVYHFSDEQIKKQLRLLLLIALVQLPLSVYQRYQLMLHHRWTGDPVFGTLMISSIMSIFLIGVICVAAGLMLRGRMSKFAFFWLFVLCVIPTTINETKSTVLLLPLALVTTLLIGSPPHRRMRIAASAVALMVVFGALYIPIYNHFAAVDNPYPYTVEEFFSSKKFMTQYLDKESDLGSRGEVGRVDSLLVPLKTFSSDPVRLLFGVGVGNGSVSSLGANYTGAYFDLLGRYALMSSGASFIIEIGLAGLAAVLLLYWLILRDSVAVALHDRTILEPVALGWVGFTLMFVVATFYKTLHDFESLSYLFWYFSGLVVAQRMRLQLDAKAVHADELRTLRMPQTVRPALARRQPRLLP